MEAGKKGQGESLEPRESCCKERIQAKRFPDPAQNQKRPARNREVFITQRWLAPALLVALVLRRNEAPGQKNESWDARAFPPCSALQFDENCRLSGRLGAFFVHAHGARPSLFERSPLTPLPSFPFSRLTYLRFSSGVLRAGLSACLRLPNSCKVFSNCGSEPKAEYAHARRNSDGKTRGVLAVLTGIPADDWKSAVVPVSIASRFDKARAHHLS